MFLYDKKDEHLVKQFKWHISKAGYAQSRTCKRHTGYNYFHRLILNAKDDEIVDHINENKLDNRRENLRLVNKSVNELNSEKARPRSKTGVRGITVTNYGRYQARLTFEGKTYQLGNYKSLEDAKKAYDDKKQELLSNY